MSERPPMPATWTIAPFDWDPETRQHRRWWVKKRAWRWWVPYPRRDRAQWWENVIGFLHEDGSVSMLPGPKEFASEAEAQAEVDRRNAEDANG